jgi:aminomethyltransferase
VSRLPIGTAVHERTFPLCESLNFRECRGYYAVSAYEAHHEHEYNAIRQACALIDISPLYKYLVTGKDATRLVDRVVTRDVRKLAVGSVIYTPWCTRTARTIDDGTVSRLGDSLYRWTAADPSLRWLRQNAPGLDVQIEDVSEQVAALALQGPTSGRLLRAVAEADVENLKYFKVTSGKIAGVPVDISRTGYTGDLGYEIWMPWKDAVRIWDALMEKGKAFDIHAAGMLALDVSRVEAGFCSSTSTSTDRRRRSSPRRSTRRSRWASRGSSRSTRAVSSGRTRSARSRSAAPSREIVGLELDWDAIESIYERLSLAPADSGRRFACLRAGVRRRRLGREGDVHDLVPDAQEDDRARHDPGRPQLARHAARHGVHRGGRPAPRARGRGQDTVLQSAS